MKTILFTIATILLLSSCKATQAPAYQEDRAPEDRDSYNGLTGLAQYQKDQSYLLNKELEDKCSAAKVDLAVAQSENNEKVAKAQQDIIKRTCR